MSESPERPRLTRRQLREMEQARQAAQEPTPSADQASSAAEASGDSTLPPPPTRPTMTRRQLREAAQREAAEREAAEREAQARAAQERVAAEHAAAEQQAAERETARRQVADRRAAEAQREQEFAAQQRAAQEQRAAYEQREAQARVAQERAAADQGAPDRQSIFPAADQSRPGFYPAPQNWHATSERLEEDVTREQHSAPPQQASPAQPQVPQSQASPPTQHPASPAQPQAHDHPNVRPPAGVQAIRTVEETGELSPILQTAPGESVWPSIPGATAESSEPSSAEPETITPASPAVPFRAPAWGARTSAATQEAAAAEPSATSEQSAATEESVDAADSAAAGDNLTPSVPPRGTESGGISGMSTAPTRWPGSSASRGLTVGPPSGSVFPGAQARSPQPTSPAAELRDDEDEEEYEPMFTWLRLLVLMIIAFVLGALVWLIIDQTDAGAAAASVLTITGLKIPLGD